MKKLVLLLAVLFAANLVSAQEEEKKEDEVPPNGWSKTGTIQLLFNQSSFNNEWIGGGTSSIAGNLTLNYDFNYRMDDFTWDNKILANYGLTKLKGDDYARKTSDRLEFNSIAGKQLPNSNWYYSYFLNFRTQFTKGYVYSEDAETGETIRTETTHFLSPGYLQTGPGMMWKKNENLYVNIAPATARLIFVDSDFTSTPGYVDGQYFGVDQGKSTRFEFGASVSAFAKYEILENVVMEHSLGLYSNYLDKPGNIDIDYLMNLQLGINKYISANLLFQAIYDDNAVAAFQIREVFGLGLNYNF
ncbi:DUF3078 domain-containing protein [Gillisia sp. M10.2A]|uniref:DUF3078 domain-containing protein n=1 Tax=Gillisia lutea TaxID=2909668 RepID=A0ABS9ECK6_9FLAO|nr:DUF3078 domain-containing protein [Gillisia lutea]MCF4100513.1 DUF3078 domain-containing protein [Gillisia lutea]